MVNNAALVAAGTAVEHSCRNTQDAVDWVETEHVVVAAAAVVAAIVDNDNYRNQKTSKVVVAFLVREMEDWMNEGNIVDKSDCRGMVAQSLVDAADDDPLIPEMT